MQLCQVPTFVVRKPATVGYRRVLVAVDYDGEAAGRVAAAAAMTRAPHQEVLRALAADDDLAPRKTSSEAQAEPSSPAVGVTVS
ncbi:hypothetical protein [Ramlibacter sp. Leaf400]|uniref:hypothetical protein n=1 Tax=Ramlibacter sp. Leaf400 TaxID=1736365 RepID=UPI0006FD0723|nr:hypothetical protein [Ramlibacter sp. Leaf400]KQT13344.1 hypothetical protein ASG30_20530 [Ramlibacter sp. Leaf400]